MSKVIEKTTEKLPKYVRRLTGGTYEARKMINGRTIRVSGKNLTEVMLEFEIRLPQPTGFRRWVRIAKNQKL